MTEPQPQTARVYVSGWLEYQIDNPNAISDASAFTPDELDPDGTSNLRIMPEAAYRTMPMALVLEVGKRIGSRGFWGPIVPGATFLQGRFEKLSAAPIDGQSGAA